MRHAGAKERRLYGRLVRLREQVYLYYLVLHSILVWAQKHHRLDLRWVSVGHLPVAKACIGLGGHVLGKMYAKALQSETLGKKDYGGWEGCFRVWLDGTHPDSDWRPYAFVQLDQPCKLWKFCQWWLLGILVNDWEHITANYLQRGALPDYLGYRPAKSDSNRIQQLVIRCLSYINSFILQHPGLSGGVLWIIRHSVDSIIANSNDDFRFTLSSLKQHPWRFDNRKIDFYLW